MSSDTDKVLDGYETFETLSNSESNNEKIPFKHATDRRVEGEIFVRLSKEEKRQQKYERSKATRAAQHKKMKARKREIRASNPIQFTEEEKEEASRLRKEKAIAVQAHLTRAMNEGLRVVVDLSFSPQSAAPIKPSNDLKETKVEMDQEDSDKVEEEGEEGHTPYQSQHSVNTERETNSLAKQLTYLYGALRKCEGLISLNLVSYCGLAAEKLECSGCRSWLVHRKNEPLEQCYDIDELIYLTPDAEDELTTLDSKKVYVIGGIVDRTPNKGISIKKAINMKVQTARLPLSLVEGFTSQKVILNIDTVVRALAAYQDTNDWSTALLRVLPKRHALKARKQLPKKRKLVNEDGDSGRESRRAGEPK